MNDSIDVIREQWHAILPDINTEPLAIVGRIRLLAHMIQARSDSVLAKHGITRAEFDILSLLVRTAKPMSPSEIATTSLTSQPGTTKRLKKLIASGFVVRTVNPLDGRSAFVHPTDKAQEVLAPALNSISAYERELLSAMSPQSRDVLVHHLRELMIVVEGLAQIADES